MVATHSTGGYEDAEDDAKSADDKEGDDDDKGDSESDLLDVGSAVESVIILLNLIFFSFSRILPLWLFEIPIPCFEGILLNLGLKHILRHAYKICILTMRAYFSNFL